MSTLYPKLLDPATLGGGAPAIDAAPTYTDIFNEFFGPTVAPDAGIDDLISQAQALNDAFGAELPAFDADISPLFDPVGNPLPAFDTSGGDALQTSYAALLADAKTVCAAFTTALDTAGVPGSGGCDAAAVGAPPAGTGGGGTGGGGTGGGGTGGGGTGGGGTGGGGTGGGGSTTPPPDPNFVCGSDSLPYAVTLRRYLRQFDLNGEPGFFVFIPSDLGSNLGSFYGGGEIAGGPSDMCFVISLHQVQSKQAGFAPFFTNWLLIVYPKRVGSFNLAIQWAPSANSPPAVVACFSFDVVQPQTQPVLTPYTPQTPAELMAQMPGAPFSRQVIDLGTYSLGANPKPTWSDNTQWAFPTSGIYTNGEVFAGPDDMLVTWGDIDDPASPGAYTQIGFVVIPIRVGTWSWLVRFYQNAQNTIPFFMVCTATVTP